MNIKNVFKKLILLNFGVLILTAVLVFFESEEVIIFNERMFASSDVLLIISLICIWLSGLCELLDDFVNC